MREITEKKWGELSKIWQELYRGNGWATPFQSYEYLTLTGKGKVYYKEPFRLAGLKECNLLLYRDGKAIAVAPLLIKKQNGNTVIHFRGHFTKACCLDFIYDETFGYEDFEFLMNSIKSKFIKPTFFWDRVREESPTCEYMKKYIGETTQTKTCFFIPIPESHEVWLKGLHKSIRNNLSNRNHRLQRDQIDVKMKVYSGREVDDATHKKMMAVYADRYLTKNKYHFGPFKLPCLGMMQYILKKDKLTQWLKKSACNFHAVLFFDDKIAAFTSGLSCKGRRIVLMRLAIKTQYAKYAPGNVLLNHVIRHITEQNHRGITDIRELHLGEGGSNGMEYKQAHGGVGHHLYTFTTQSATRPKACRATINV